MIFGRGHSRLDIAASLIVFLTDLCKVCHLLKIKCTIAFFIVVVARLLRCITTDLRISFFTISLIEVGLLEVSKAIISPILAFLILILAFLIFITLIYLKHFGEAFKLVRICLDLCFQDLLILPIKSPNLHGC